MPPNSATLLIRTVSPCRSRIGFIVAALVVGCTTEPCDCLPGTSSLIFYGHVLTADSQPVEGAAITVTLTVPECVFPATGSPSLTVTTGPDGAFRTDSARGEAGAEGCIRITAHSPLAGRQLIASSEGVVVRFPRTLDAIDSVEVSLQAQTVIAGPCAVVA